MVELQSCGGLVINAAALCGIEQVEVKGGETTPSAAAGINVVAEISEELRRERQKNAELMERISMLEAQILQQRHHNQGSCADAIERSFKKFKRQKMGASSNEVETTSQIKNETRSFPPKDAKLLVNWMSMDEALLVNDDNKLKDDDFMVEYDDTDDTDEEDDCEIAETHFSLRNVETDVNSNQLDSHLDSVRTSGTNRMNANLHEEIVDERIDLPEPLPCRSEEINVRTSGRCPLTDTEQSQSLQDHQNNDKEESENGSKPAEDLSGNISYVRKPPKVAFCPKEVKRILEAEALPLKNAQSHTIRKIIVFASLGIRHGCDEMYELDFNHFRILQKGEPYISPKDPGEHVLYENPGVRRKIFYPNRQNPTLCPVQIVEEENAMRPSDSSCPSFLFLCIKYGGRTRNLPQNEYVRQRMGRNKLKSFGPVMCRMARLIHVRSGSFFFKALGITLLFMAGFRDDMVQRETKYRSLDLLQKYCRTDKDAEGEELFLPHPTINDTAGPGLEKLTRKTTTSTKSKGKKQANCTNRHQNLPRSLVPHPAPSNSNSVLPTGQFGLMSYASIQTHPQLPTFQSMPSQTSSGPSPVANQVKNMPLEYHMIPPQPAGNTFVAPMVYWSTPNSFHHPADPYASMFNYQSFPSTANYISLHPQHYYNYPQWSSLVDPKMAARNGKNDMNLEEADDSSSDSSSSDSETKDGQVMEQKLG